MKKERNKHDKLRNAMKHPKGGTGAFIPLKIINIKAAVKDWRVYLLTTEGGIPYFCDRSWCGGLRK